MSESPIRWCWPCLIALLLAAGSASAAYIANINDDPTFVARRQADTQLLSADYAAALSTYETLLKTSSDADAQYLLGLMHWQGLGTTADIATARGWWLRAAEQGHAAAARRLYELAPDDPDAADWLGAAIKAGSQRARALQVQARLAASPGLAKVPSQIVDELTALAPNDNLANLLLGLLALERDDPEAAALLHRVVTEAGSEAALQARAANLLAVYYQRHTERELAYFFSLLGDPTRSDSSRVPTRERRQNPDRDTLASFIEPRQRQRISQAADKWQKRRGETAPAAQHELQRLLAPWLTDCKALDQAIDTAIASAKLGRTPAEIQTDVQNYLPLRDASLSAHAARLELARRLLADFDQLPELTLPSLRQMVQGKCRLQGYSPLTTPR